MELGALLAAAEELRRSGDEIRADQLEQLEEKRRSGRFYIAFCGHFSAGKSTMINRLCGHPLLPSSPIPTSANIVQIRNGEPAVRIERSWDGGDKREETIGLEDLAEAARNGETVESVDITYPIPFLGERTVLLDTPGIDSTDDAHRMSTESALHLADVVFYMMDYNHVQSELNFAFTKQLKEWGKPVYLIVNQVDKHNAEELPFEAYRQSVRDSFAQWNIEPDGILYLSLKEPGHPFDEWDAFTALLDRLIVQADELRIWSVGCSAEQVVRRHAKAFADGREPRKTELREAAERHGNPETLSSGLEGMKESYAGLMTEVDRQAAVWKKEAESLIENANLIPAATRDLAGRYLETRKPGFRVGLFNRAVQTEKEASARLGALQLDFAEQIRVNLSFHLKSLLKKLAELHGLDDTALSAEIDALEMEPDADWLAGQVSAGAVFSGEYTMTYSKLISAEMKAEYRRSVLRILERMQDALKARFAGVAAELAADIGEREAQLAAYRELQALEREERDRLQRLLQMAAAVAPGEPPALPGPAAPAQARAAGAARHADVPAHAAGVAAGVGAAAAGGRGAPHARTGRAAPQAGAAAAGAGTSGAGAARAGLLRAEAARLREAAALLGGLPAMKSIVRAMRDKADRLTQSRFTIALFGAFSAGKSSLANALMGERILPVSPNPTTAAINKIAPPSADWPHGTAKVVMKKPEAMLEEVRYSLDILGLPGGDWETCLLQIASLAPNAVQPNGKPHYSFLKAFAKGWPDIGSLLGQELRIGLDAFSGYVAEEQKSCFVHSIELYHANPLTEQGIVLVDTPGADSINARHTGVAFNYIKNADAILFVTYYNHAFSQADREFLMQLGRVKDAFELDKMFFLVNASDLAADETELAQVLSHVEASLQKHGVRQARLYPVSSQQAVQAKLSGDEDLLQQSGLYAFEQDFFRFSVEELTAIAVRSARQELERAAQVLNRWMDGAREGERERESKREALAAEYRNAERFLADAPLSADIRDLQQEIRELLYYVKQRTGFRFGEFFQLAFNPSTLREDAGDIRKALRACWLELVRLVSYSLSQEVLATTLRTEQFLHKQGEKKYEVAASAVQKLLTSFEHEVFRPYTFATPPVEEQLSLPEPEARWLAGLFKNGRQFFENDGKKQLRDELEKRISETVDAYAERHRNVLEEAYASQNASWAEQQRAALLDAAKEHFEGLHDALEQKTDFARLSEIREQLRLISAPSR